MIEKAALLADLKPIVRALESDLLHRAEQESEFAIPLKAEWQRAHESQRTAATYESWLDGEVTQAAAAWVLSTVFLRFCEDNGLIDLPYLAGPGERMAVASERQQEFFERKPHETDRDWIVAGFDSMTKASAVVAGLFDRTHNPMWRLALSHSAAKDLLAFWRTRGTDGAVIHDFTDPAWDTRFLGDLYQDLSERAKAAYALLQTPDFVEELILDLTLDYAIDQFGLEPEPSPARPDLPGVLRVIDPACGSGHFMLGAFRRILRAWQRQAPGTDIWELITRIMSGLHGVDKNPFAVSIARFRLVIAVMRAAEVERLSDTPDFSINIAIGDSLLYGRGGPGVQGEIFSIGSVHSFITEDISAYIRSVDILGSGSYHVVIGNPPYFTVRDKRENEIYRSHYSTCSGKYPLSVPFAERFFQLARRGNLASSSAGYVGQITNNSFAKRAFGKKLIEQYFRKQVNLTHVLDTSGVHLPGFGVPTLILVGRNQTPIDGSSIRVVRGKRGEAWAPGDPLGGAVWSEIVYRLDLPGTECEWISTADVQHDRLATHPWILSGGGADSLTEYLECAPYTLGDKSADIGMTVLTLEDEAYLVSEGTAIRRGLSADCVRLVNGDEVRDYTINAPGLTIMPYDSSGSERTLDESTLRYLWPYRVNLQNRLYFKRTPEQRGLRWFDLGMYFNHRADSIRHSATGFT